MVDKLRRRVGGMTPLALFLAGTLALAGWLGYQAFATAVSHRRIAEDVLLDYARISATEMARLSNGQLDDVLDDVFSPVSEGRVRRRGEPSAAVLRWEMSEAMDHERCDCPGFRNPIAVFRISPGSGIEVAPDTLSGAILDRVVSRVLAEQAVGTEEHGLAILTAEQTGGDPVAVGYTRPNEDGDADPLPIYGFVVGVGALGELFEEWYQEESLLPSAIAGGQPNDSLLHVSIADPSGTPVFASPVGFPTRLNATASLNAEYGGLVVSAAIRPDAASRLVIGGLPRSRLPLITMLLLLTLGVGTAAAVQLRREQTFQRLRDDFVSGVSHELRTPLAQIRMFAELQQSGKLTSGPDLQRAVFVIHRESVRLSHLVENILQFSRLRRPPEHHLPTERLDLADALTDGFEAVMPLLEDRGMRLDVQAQPDLPVEANREALTRIVVNLLDNAVKYGPKGQTLEVRLERVNGSARFSVADEGPGVPAKDRRRIWNPYYRLERDVRAQVPGTGIGLSVVSDLASAHGGRAWVEDASPRGARFVVELPLVAAPAAQLDSERDG